MTSNADLITEARERVEGSAPTEAEVLAYKLADALEAATVSSETGQVMHAWWQERAERAEATLAKVREWAENVPPFVAFNGPSPDIRAAKILAILDADDPAAEPSDHLEGGADA